MYTRNKIKFSKCHNSLHKSRSCTKFSARANLSMNISILWFIFIIKSIPTRRNRNNRACGMPPPPHPLHFSPQMKLVISSAKHSMPKSYFRSSSFKNFLEDYTPGSPRWLAPSTLEPGLYAVPSIMCRSENTEFTHFVSFL